LNNQVQNQNSNRIPMLDGIRALAVILVVASHYGLGHIIPGGFGVTVFFFLSGYLITTLLLDEHREKGFLDLKGFYYRRALRILPPMYFACILGATLALTGVVDSEMTLGGVGSQLFHYTNYYLVFSSYINVIPGLGLLWSLAVEEHFYLVFPMILVVSLKYLSFKKVGIILFIFCAFILTWRYYLDLTGASNTRLYMATDTRIDSILFGCILALTWNPINTNKSFVELRFHYGTIVVGIFSLVLLLYCFINRDETFRYVYRFSIQGVGLFFLFWLCIRYHSSVIFSWLDSKPLRYLGKISFSIYLLHYLVYLVINDFFMSSHLLTSVLSVIITVFLADLIYRFIEKPLGKIRRQLKVSKSKIVRGRV